MTWIKQEAEAVALAVQVKAKWALAGRAGRAEVAKSPGLKVTGVLGSCFGRNVKQVVIAPKALDELRQKAGFRIERGCMLTL